MAQRPSTYRVYVHDYPSFQNHTKAQLPDEVEIQIVLEFARENATRQGIFQPLWDPRINAEAIANFKNLRQGSKFFVSIGGPDAFSVPADNGDAWIANALNTLDNIIKDYGLDGIDVYYTGFDPAADDDALRRLLASLWEESKKISMVAANPDLDTNYNTLFHNICKSNDNGTVLYQFQKGGT